MSGSLSKSLRSNRWNSHPPQAVKKQEPTSKDKKSLADSFAKGYKGFLKRVTPQDIPISASRRSSAAAGFTSPFSRHSRPLSLHLTTSQSNDLFADEVIATLRNYCLSLEEKYNGVDVELLEPSKCVLERFLPVQEIVKNRDAGTIPIPSGWDKDDHKAQLMIHYTHASNVQNIKNIGLCSQEELIAHGVRPRTTGQAFGSGVYFSSTPYAFCPHNLNHNQYGHHHYNSKRTGIVALVVPGPKRAFDRNWFYGSGVVRYSNSRPQAFNIVEDEKAPQFPFTTIVGNKSARHALVPFGKDKMLPSVMKHNMEYVNEYVVQNSKQILPLLSFDPYHVMNTEGNREILSETINELQKALLPHFEFLNLMESYDFSAMENIVDQGLFAQIPPTRQPTLSSYSNGYWNQRLNAGNPRAAVYTQPSLRVQTNGYKGPDFTFKYDAPDSLDSDSGVKHAVGLGEVREKECSICFDAITETSNVGIITACGHAFHKDCLKAALKHKGNCPTCRKVVSKPQGAQPSGKMQICYHVNGYNGQRCQGFPQDGVIEIKYDIPSGIQKAYQSNPGVGYSSAVKIGILPFNTEGEKVLKRLVYSFSHGLTLSVGTSLTTGYSNVVTWGSVHHKSQLWGGVQAHGFPDPGYFLNVNDELDALSVPSATDCEIDFLDMVKRNSKELQEERDRAFERRVQRREIFQKKMAVQKIRMGMKAMVQARREREVFRRKRASAMLIQRWWRVMGDSEILFERRRRRKALEVSSVKTIEQWWKSRNSNLKQRQEARAKIVGALYLRFHSKPHRLQWKIHRWQKVQKEKKARKREDEHTARLRRLPSGQLSMNHKSRCTGMFRCSKCESGHTKWPTEAERRAVFVKSNAVRVRMLLGSMYSSIDTKGRDSGEILKAIVSRGKRLAGIPSHCVGLFLTNGEKDFDMDKLTYALLMLGETTNGKGAQIPTAKILALIDVEQIEKEIWSKIVPDPKTKSISLEKLVDWIKAA